MRADTDGSTSERSSSNIESRTSSGRPAQDSPYPRPRTERVAAYERRMQVVNPDYRLPLIDVWDPVLAEQLDNVRRDGHGWIRGDLGDVTLRYRKSRLRDVCVDLEVLDRSSGRRLRQDASSTADLFNRLDAICS